MMGRKSIFTAALAKAICDRLAEGESLRAICRGEGMPSARTVARWAEEKEEFCQHYARAREFGCDSLADEILEIADAPYEKTENGTIDSAEVQSRRAMIDARKWYLSKIMPKKYGDRIAVEAEINVSLAERMARMKAAMDGDRHPADGNN